MIQMNSISHLLNGDPAVPL